MRPLPGQLPRPTAGFACEAWNAAPAAAENHGNSWAFRPPCAGSFLSDDIFHLAKIPRIPHFPSAVRSDLFPSKLKSLSFIVQFLTIGGSRCSSELGNGRETCWTVPLSIFQQSTAWGMGVSLGHRSGHIWCMEREGVERSEGYPRPHDIQGAQKGTNAGKAERGKKQKKSSRPGQKVTKNAMKITTLNHYQVSQN